MFYIIIAHDIINQTVKILDIMEDYNLSLLKFIESYESYVDDNTFIVRTTNINKDTNCIEVYKRIYGTFWNSKKLVFKISLIKFSN